jgi:hypothetical protein
VSNDSQSVVQTTTYDAFGNIESSTGTTGMPGSMATATTAMMD